jgi:hypothetical protein
MIVVALLAAGAMVINDVFGVLMVQAEARNRGVLAGLFDSLQWFATITTTTISVTALQGNNFWEKALVIVLVTAANLIGSYVGVVVGKRFIKETLV